MPLGIRSHEVGLLSEDMLSKTVWPLSQDARPRPRGPTPNRVVHANDASPTRRAGRHRPRHLAPPLLAGNPPDQWDLVQANPHELIDQAVEEVLRYEAHVRRFPRMTVASPSETGLTSARAPTSHDSRRAPCHDGQARRTHRGRHARAEVQQPAPRVCADDLLTQ
jgi:hypothetical protein